MVDSDQGGRSSRPLSACQKRNCGIGCESLTADAIGQSVLLTSNMLWPRQGRAVAMRIYRKADMERMMTRNLIKQAPAPRGEHA